MIIPWNYKILDPTYSELRKYDGKCGLIERELGAREPNEWERYIVDSNVISLWWNGELVNPIHNQLKKGRGDLNVIYNSAKEAEKNKNYSQNYSNRQYNNHDPNDTNRDRQNYASWNSYQGRGYTGGRKDNFPSFR
jgi:hypothetical protein